MFGRALILATSVLILGCTQPVSPPQLPQKTEPAVSYVVLSDHLAPGDIRRVFQALNHNGKLNSLRPWLESPKDSDLEWLAAFLSKFIYEEALDQKGLPALVHRSIAQHNFSRAERNALDWSQSTGVAAEKDLLWVALRSSHLVPSAQHAARLLHPELDPFYRPISSIEPLPSEIPAWDSLLEDSARLLGDSQLKRFALRKTKRWYALQTIPSLLEGVTVAQSNFGIEVFNSLGKSFKEDLAGFVQLKELLRYFNRPSDGLFTDFEDNLHANPDDLRYLARMFESLIVKAGASNVSRSLSGKDSKLDKKFWLALGQNPTAITPEFKVVMGRVAQGLEKLVRKSDPALGKQLRLFLSSYVVSKWLAQLHSLPKVREALEQSEESFPEWWKRSFEISDFELKLNRKNAAGEFELVNDFQAMNLDTGLLKYHLSVGDLDKTEVSIDKTASSIDAALSLAVETVHRILPIGDPTALFLSVVKSLELDKFESGNMLQSLLNYCSGISTPMLTAQVRLLLDGMELRNISPDTRDIILGLFRGPNEQWVGGVLDNIPVLGKLVDDNEAQSLAFIHSLVRGFSSSKMEGLTDAISLFTLVPVGHADSDGRALIPAIDQWFTNGVGPTNLLRALGAGSRDYEIRNIAGATISKVALGLEPLWNLSEELIVKARPGVNSLASRVAISSLLNWSPEQREWVVRLLESEELEKAAAFLAEHGSREEAVRGIRELIALSQDGTLAEAFQLLLRIQSDRMQQAASVLLEWEKSGELLAFLRTLDVYLSP